MSKKTGSTVYCGVLLLSLFTVFTATSIQPAKGQVQSDYSIKSAFPQLTFSSPVGIVDARDGTNRLFVVGQAGVIWVFENSPTTAAATVFLNITDRVLYGGEQGLLGLAFHPNFTQNGYFYVDYVAANPTRTVIARYTETATNTNQTDKNSELILLEISHPYSNHKGGQLAFGPDGYLYVGVGDGGSEGDPLGNGQNLSTLLGKILRIDVNTSSNESRYGIPPDNPFAGNTLGYKEEIYAYGLRNPWRFSFDNLTGRLWAGDVGQDRVEEIDLIQNGKNYGWNTMEGSLCYNPPSGCNETGLELPVYEYDHSQGNAIIGGYVYRGSALPTLLGSYVYGDYRSGGIWALTYNLAGGSINNLVIESNLTISSFGVDAKNELYICAFDGKIYALTLKAVPEFPLDITYVVLTGIGSLFLLAIWKRKI